MPVPYVRLRQPVSIDRLENMYSRIRRNRDLSHLRRGGNKLIEGEGNDATPIAFIIGEAPGAQEAVQGRPFVGPSGAILRQLMRVAGLHATWYGRNTGLQMPPFCEEALPPNVWLTNTIKYRPPGNRTPTPTEVGTVRHFVKEEWRIVGAPKLVIPVGSVALSAIAGTAAGGILHVAGKPRTNSAGVTIYPMIHPSFGLRNEAIQPVMELHWLELGDWLAKNRGQLSR